MEICCQGKFIVHTGIGKLPTAWWEQPRGMGQHMTQHIGFEDASMRRRVMGTKLSHHFG